MLFRAYCTPNVWLSAVVSTSYVLHMHMRFDNCYRSHDGAVLLNFVLNSVSSLPDNMRKLAFSLWHSLQISDNSLVNAVLSSDLFFKSPFF